MSQWNFPPKGGYEDFAVSLGVKRSKDNDELDYARRHLVVAAKAAGKLAVDTVYTDVNDEMGLRKMTEQGRRLGYDGKFVISPPPGAGGPRRVYTHRNGNSACPPSPGGHGRSRAGGPGRRGPERENAG